ncbi:MAG TPA: hypothetical protein DCS43_04995 [Verrucomicrobia bacterium]|nr:hypothetical protein [Verrucomicrobiota bacterium]
MSDNLQVRPLATHEYNRWNRLVAEAPSGSPYARTDYLTVLSETTGDRFSCLGVFHGEELVGGCPLYFRRSKVGDQVIRRPLLACLSPVIREVPSKSPHRRASRQLAVLCSLANYLKTVDCAHMVLVFSPALSDIRPFQSAGWTVRPEYSFLIDLSDMEAAWNRVDHNQARLIRRAEAAGLVITNDDDFDSFFRLHIEIHKRKQATIYLPEEKFRAYFNRLKALNLCRLYHARLPNGKAIARQLVLTGPHPVTHTVCAGSDADYLSLGGNPFLRWKVCESLSAIGYRANDLSGAPYPHDVSRFKSQLGAELVLNWIAVRPETLRYRAYKRIIHLVRKFARHRKITFKKGVF